MIVAAGHCGGARPHVALVCGGLVAPSCLGDLCGDEMLVETFWNVLSWLDAVESIDRSAARSCLALNWFLGVLPCLAFQWGASPSVGMLFDCWLDCFKVMVMLLLPDLVISIAVGYLWGSPAS